MNFVLRNIVVEELSYKVNNVRLEKDAKIDLAPKISCQVRNNNENKNLKVVALEAKIETASDAVKPFNLTARVAGLFEVKDFKESDNAQLAMVGSQLLYPYVRTTVANVTANAFTVPVMLPISLNLNPAQQQEKKKKSDVKITFGNTDYLN